MFTIVVAAYETVEILALKSKYIKWSNAADIANLLLITASLVLTRLEIAPEFTHNMVLFMFVLLWQLVILKYMTAIEFLRFFIGLTLASTIAILPFFTVMALFIISYSQLLILMNNDSSLATRGIEAYMFALGELPEELTGFGFVAFVAVLINNVMITIVLLNLVIAILSDKYEEVVANKQETDARAKLEKILEFEQIYAFFKKIKDSSPRYLIVKTALRDDEEDEWTGVYGTLEKSIKDLKKDIFAKLSANQAEVKAA